MTQPTGDLRDDVERARAALVEAEAVFSASLEADDLVSRVAFVLYQRDVLSESDWPEDRPVTWEDWHDLQIDSERDEYRRMADEIITLVRREIDGTDAQEQEG